MATPFGSGMSAPLGSAPGGYDQPAPQQQLPPLTLQGLGLLPAAQPRERDAIDLLGPGTELHRDVLAKLQAMFRYSATEMQKRYTQWQYMEMQVQAYVRLPDYDRAMQQLNMKDALPPEPVKVIVPYNYSTLHAGVTYLATVLIQRNPMFPLNATRGTVIDKARAMELALMDGVRQSKGYEVLRQWLWDQLLYSFGAGVNLWEVCMGPRLNLIGGQRNFNEGLIFAGNRMTNIDPYMFFPDPRVPMSQVSQRGDFIFWQTQQSLMTLKDYEAQEKFRWIDAGVDKNSGQPGDQLGPGEFGPIMDMSARRARIGQMGEWSPSPNNVVSFHAVREGTVRLVPKDWKLGDKDTSELWKFTILNGKQIVQAEPLRMIHRKHPVFVGEPTSMGYDFGSISMADMIAPFQDLISWHINSRLENVRATVNNQFVYDPARIEAQDLRSPAAGKAIRLKKAAAGTPLDQAIQQLTVVDVTANHIKDIQMLRVLADSITGINDNMRGMQQAGGRRSATEARQALQAAAGRMGELAARISGQGLQDLVEQQIMNIQQFMPDEMWVEVTGEEGMVSTLLRPDMIAGTFNYQISDGSLPFDKMALAEVWKEILIGIMRDPELRQRYDLNKIFEYVAQLSGAKNISSFRAQLAQQGPQMADPAALARGAANGSLVPIGTAVPAAGRFMQ